MIFQESTSMFQTKIGSFVFLPNDICIKHDIVIHATTFLQWYRLHVMTLEILHAQINFLSSWFQLIHCSFTEFTSKFVVIFYDSQLKHFFCLTNTNNWISWDVKPWTNKVCIFFNCKGELRLPFCQRASYFLNSDLVSPNLGRKYGNCKLTSSFETIIGLFIGIERNVCELWELTV